MLTSQRLCASSTAAMQPFRPLPARSPARLVVQAALQKVRHVGTPSGADLVARSRPLRLPTSRFPP
jgi:hypothetical protein